MAWQDRDYHQSSDGSGGGHYLSNPAAFLSFSLPLGSWLGVRVRLHFWLLLTFLFLTIDNLQAGQLRMLPVAFGLVLLALVLHELGHRLAARSVGGTHDEFVLWPAGGMAVPIAPPYPGPMFIANVGGIAVSLALALVCALAYYRIEGAMPLPFIWPLASFGCARMGVLQPLWTSGLWAFMAYNIALVVDNLLPYEWFDGGRLWHSVLWPWTGLHRAINITCIAGMVLAVPMFALAVYGRDFLGMVVWALLFSSCYVRRKQLQAEGTHEMEEAIAFSAAQSQLRGSSRRARWGRAAALARQAARERRDQRRIDAILDKVHQSGMQSLNWFERRALRKATQRQRRREDQSGRS